MGSVMSDEENFEESRQAYNQTSSDDETESVARDNTLRSMIRIISSARNPDRGRRSNVVSLTEETDTDSDESAPVMRHDTPDTSRIERNDISQLTGGAEGKPSTLLSILNQRALAKSSTSKTRKRLSGYVLPDTETTVASFRNKVFCGVYGRDGDIFLSACQDRNIRVYDTSRGNFKLLQTIQARDVGWSVLDVALSPDGCHVVYSSWNDYLYQVHILGENYSAEGYNVQQVPLCLDPPGHPGHNQFCIFSVKFSQDSSEILGGANDGCIYLYDREASSQSLSIKAHENDVNAVCFVDETTHILASGGDDGLCKVWDRRSLRESNPQPVGVLAGHSDGITYLDPRGDGRYLISNCKDQSIKLWDIRQFSRASDVAEFRKTVRRNHGWDYRWESVPKGVSRQSRLAGDSSVMTYTIHSVLQTLIRCHFSPQFTTGQKYIYTGCASGSVVIYDLLTGEVVKVLSGHRACVRDVSWHPYLPQIVSSSWDFTVNRWDHCGEAQEEIRLEREMQNYGCPGGTKRKKCVISGREDDQLMDYL